MLIIPIAKDHRVFGKDFNSEEKNDKVETISYNDEGEMVINTSAIGKDIIGYGGPVPVEITLKDNKIYKIKPLDNQETPEFFGAVVNSSLLESLKGKTLEEAQKVRIDAVTGATYTSKAIIENIKTGIDYALVKENQPVISKVEKNENFLTIKFFATIIIILSGAIIPFYLRNRIYRNIQLLLNVVILGFWGGTFISYSLMVSYLTNGITQIILIPTVLMLVTAFIYPLFGKINHYCNWLCPYGSLQELLSKCIKYKVNISPSVTHSLIIFRNILWFALMWLLWTGLWFSWMGYEPFAAFFFRDASAVVLAIAGGFLLLSLIVQRPYCRFVCPTGTLFKFSEGSN